jgi:hypothetical protein
VVSFGAALTGYGAEGDKQRSRQVGFDADLVKPVGPDSLQRILLQDARRGFLPHSVARAGTPPAN